MEKQSMTLKARKKSTKEELQVLALQNNVMSSCGAFNLKQLNVN